MAASEIDLFAQLCSYDNLHTAFINARKGKTLKSYVIQFEAKLEQNLLQLQHELVTHTYKPHPLEIFILRDPKTRKISKSHFRDRVIHHAVCNVIEPIFDKSFIADSCANRKRKGTLYALQRFDIFKRKVSKNNTRQCYVLKADIKHYFETIDRTILMEIIRKKIKDANVLWLIQIILDNHARGGASDAGMPLGNLTSQFFANVYLNELDQFVKHTLKAKYYLRYVDDFVLLHHAKRFLHDCKKKINLYLKNTLHLELHPDKSRICDLDQGVGFVGFRVYFHHRLVKKRNLRGFEARFKEMHQAYSSSLLSREQAAEQLEGWLAYASHADTYKYRKEMIQTFNRTFLQKPLLAIQHNKKHENLLRKIEQSNLPFSSLKSTQFFKKGLEVHEIAALRSIQIGTVWEHLATCIEHNQLSVWKVLPKETVTKILPHIHFSSDPLKYIKKRLRDDTISYDEIQCVLAQVKCKEKRYCTENRNL